MRSKENPTATGLPMIDPHVHLRDWKQRETETLAHGFSVAWRAGISAVFEMPNTAPALTTRAALLSRQQDADKARTDLGLPIFHGMYAGLTADESQPEEMVRTYRELYPRIVGFKLYAGHSTGRMGVTRVTDQLRVWESLTRAGFTGVVAVHAEREELLRPDAWDSTKAESHSAARPPLAEVAAVQTQLALAEAAGFRGHLHLCHVSVADTVAMVRAEESALPFSVSMGATPHHLLLDAEVARGSTFPEWNVNPPLREENNRRALWAAFLQGEIDWIESDHAPHTLADKKAGASGLPGLAGFRLLVERVLAEQGTRLTDVHRLTVTRVLEVFGLDPTEIPDNPNSPFGVNGAVRAGRPQFDYDGLAQEYPHDPYRTIRSPLRFQQLDGSDTLSRIHHE